ncbi:MAG: hypothetical protein M1815_001099 [Lichina confinis]|nr:MAG: hypothetical protein M1815_001099 [Lichina confinis]
MKSVTQPRGRSSPSARNRAKEENKGQSALPSKTHVPAPINWPGGCGGERAIKQMLFGDVKVADEMAAGGINRVGQADERIPAPATTVN